MTHRDVGIVTFYVLFLFAFGAALMLGLAVVAAMTDALP